MHGHASWTSVLIEPDVMLLQQADDAIEWLTVCRPGAVIEPALAVLQRGMKVGAHGGMVWSPPLLQEAKAVVAQRVQS